MAKERITWDAPEDRLFETGVKHGVIYPVNGDGEYKPGVAWNGLTAVTETPSGAEATALYADDMKYLNLISAEEFGLTIEAYTYPDEFALCDGTDSLDDAIPGAFIGQQARKVFGFCYETTVGNAVDGNDHSRKLHLVYGCLASPSERAYQTINDSPEAITFSWEVKTTPVTVTGKKATAIVTLDMGKLNTNQIKAVEDAVYGTDPVGQVAGTDPYLPTPDQLAALIKAAPEPVE